MEFWINATFTPDKSAFRFSGCIQLTLEAPMKSRVLTLPEIGMIAGTRAAFGAGVGLLLADKLKPDTRKGAACALLLVGALSTIPIVLAILGKPEAAIAPESV